MKAFHFAFIASSIATLSIAAAFQHHGGTDQKKEAQCGCCAPAAEPQKHEAPYQAKLVKGVQVATVVIDGGYKPSQIAVVAGKPVELTFKLGDKPGCGSQLVIKELKFDKTLSKGKAEVVKFTPKKAGTIDFTCGMAMYKGKILVK